MSKRSYSDKEKASALAALDANGGNVNRTARQIGIGESTLRQWAKNQHVAADVADIREQKKEELGDIFERLTRKGLAYLEDNMSSGRYGEISIGVCQWTDKMQLLRGEATTISETRSDSAQRDRLLAEAANLAEKHGVTPDEAMDALLKANPELEKWAQ
jgi:truncated hemoglobin YjbI